MPWFWCRLFLKRAEVLVQLQVGWGSVLVLEEVVVEDVLVSLLQDLPDALQEVQVAVEGWALAPGSPILG